LTSGDRIEAHPRRHEGARSMPGPSDDTAPLPASPPSTQPGRLTRFVSSGIFFMIVGTIFLGFAYQTMGQTHSAMSFVFVVVGVGILLYGTGTQGIGEFNSTDNAEKVAKYKVALAGGAGVLAFCVAGGIIAFSPAIKNAFQIEQKYVRFYIKGKSYQSDDIGRYIPDVRINGNPVPAVRRGDYIEVYAPYIPKNQPVRFEIRAKLRLIEALSGLLQSTDAEYTVEMDKEGNVFESGIRIGKYETESGLDFPWYRLQTPVGLSDTAVPLSNGYVPR
jgi:hypothetical protein